MRKLELVVVLVVIAVFMALNRPKPSPTPAGATASPAAAPPALEPTSGGCPYALGNAHLFIDQNLLLRLDSGWHLLSEHGPVLIYQMRRSGSEQQAMVVGDQVVTLAVSGKSSDIELTRDGQPAPGLGATQAEVMSSIHSEPRGEHVAQLTSIKTSGKNWTLMWHLDGNGIVDRIHLDGSIPGPRVGKLISPSATKKDSFRNP